MKLLAKNVEVEAVQFNADKIMDDFDYKESLRDFIGGGDVILSYSKGVFGVLKVEYNKSRLSVNDGDYLASIS